MEDTVVKIEVRDQLTHDLGEQESKVEQLQRALDEMQRALARAEKFESDATMTIGQLEEKLDQLQQLADDRLEEMQQLAQENTQLRDQLERMNEEGFKPTGSFFTDLLTGSRLVAQQGARIEELEEALYKARGACKRLREERDEARAATPHPDTVRQIQLGALAEQERRELLLIAGTLARQLNVVAS